MAVDSGTIFSKVEVKLDALTADIAKIDAKFNVLKRQNDKVSNDTAKSWVGAYGKIKIAGVAAFTAITVATKQAIKTGANFEQSIANVGSVASGTAKDLEDLNNAAKEAGRTTRFTASQAADALYSLASAGLNAKDSISALDGVLEFAGATQSDLATSSALVVSTLKQFKLEATDAGKVSNVLAAGIGNSLATMDKFRLSLQYVGPVAGAMGIALEDVVGQLQALYDAGFRGQTAGFALKNVYADLADETSQVNKKLAQFGFTFEELNPATNDFATIIDNLNKKGLTTGQVIGAFGKEVGSQIVALMNAGGDAIREYTDAVTGTNAAAEAYAKQNDTLLGSFDKMKSAIEGVAILLTEKLTPGLRRVFDFVARVANKITGSNKVSVESYNTLKTAVENYNKVLEDAEGKTDAVTQAMISQARAALNLALQKAADAYADSNKNLDKYERNIKSSTEWVDKLTSQQEELAKGTGYTSDELNKLSAVERSKILIETKGQKVSLEYSQVTEKRRVYTEKLTDATIALGQAESDQEIFINTLTKGYLEENDVTKLLLDTYPELKEAVLNNVEAYKKEEAIKDESIKKAKEAYETIKANKDMTQREALAIEQLANIKIKSAKSDEEREYWTKSLAVAQALLNGTVEESAVINKKNADSTKEYNQKLEEVGKTAKQVRELERQRAIDTAKAQKGTATEIQDNVDAINDYYNAVNKQEVIDFQKEYNEKIAKVGKTTKQVMEIEKAKVIKSIKDLNLTKEEQDKLTNAVDEYYKKLESEEGKEAFKQFTDSALSSVNSILGNLGGLFSAISDSVVEDLDRELQATLKANGLIEESTIKTLEKEKKEKQKAHEEELAQLDERIALAKKAGDTKSLIVLETQRQELIASQKTVETEIDNNIKKEKITAEYEKKKAETKYKYELWAWGANLAQSIGTASAAVLKTMASIPYPFNIAPAIAQGVAGGVEIATIGASKPKKPQLATGGIILPKQGGVETVQAENGFGELSLNAGPSGNALLNDFALRIAESINNASSGNGKDIMIQLIMNDEVVSEAVAKNFNNGKVKLEL